MGYDFTVSEYWRIKGGKEGYPWPCESDQGRTITIYPDDILTKSEDGTYMKHTGLGCFGIIIPDKDVEFIKDKPAHMRLL